MREKERKAAELLKELLGGDYAPRDTAGAQGMHDFDLQLDDGTTFAVEVTTDTSRVDRSFGVGLERMSPLDVAGLDRVWYVYVSTPGDGSGNERVSNQRLDALRAELPDILRAFERVGLTKWPAPRSQSRDKSPVDVKLLGLGVHRCSSSDPSDDQSPQVFFADAFPNSNTVPSLIVDAVYDALSANEANKVKKLIRAKDVGADEAHLFVWLIPGQDHKRGRAEAMFSLPYVGLDDLEQVDLPGIDVVWVAVEVDASIGRNDRPLLRLDKHGWHYWPLTRSS